MQALQTAERVGISYTEEFSATDGKKVSWQFEGITSCTTLGGLEDGSLVLTGTVREQDIDGYRAYVRVRWHHLAAASTVKSKAERVYDI